MGTIEARGSSAAPRAEEEPPYEGAPGRTRRDAIHVPLPNGFVRSIQVYRVVNVATDAPLREAAEKLALHRFDSGEELAIPFVYHDPARRKLALVVPEALRHEELSLRAKLLAELAEHADSPIPPYVAEATTVVGAEALASYLARPPGSAATAELRQREAAVDQKLRDFEIQADALGQREARLMTRAEEVTRREDELRTWAEELEANRADLTMRESELDSRFEALRQREAELASRSESIALPPAESDDARAQEMLAEVVQLVDEVVQYVDDEVEELEPLTTFPGNVSPGEPGRAHDLADEVELVNEGTMPRAIPTAEDVEEIVDGMLVEELGDEMIEELVEPLEDEVEELEELEALPDTGLHAELLSSDTMIPRDADRDAADAPKPSVAPPGGFFDVSGPPEAHAVAEAGGVRIFVRLPEGEEALFEDGPPTLLAQLAVVDECPVVLLTLFDASAPRPTVLRAALDPRAADDRNVLENLRRRFAARLVAFSSSGAYLRATEVSAPREVNVARILDRVSKLGASRLDTRAAFARALDAPPPIDEKDHPFVGDLDRAERAVDAAARLGRLARWSEHDRMDHALLVLSIPRDQVDGAVRAILEQAVGFGLPLPGGLQERAVSLGIAPDGAQLVGRQIAAFATTYASLDKGGLTPEQAADAWEELLRVAAEQEIAIEAEAHDLAWRAIHAVRGGEGEPSEIDAASLPAMDAPALVMLLEHPRYRRDAALELARRGDAEQAETLCKAVRKMPRAEVVRVTPRIALLGEDAGDALIDGLNARKTFVRQAFALSLGHLKLRRAVVPLLHLLTSEESEIWREVARVLGSFGNASLRTLSRQLKDPKGKNERFVLTLAHLCNHGCAKQVDKLTQDERPIVAAMAVEASTMRGSARAIDEQLRGMTPFTATDAISQFSRRFYAELEGTAPEHDLEEVQ